MVSSIAVSEPLAALYQTATAQQFALSPIAERRSWRSALRVTEIPQLRCAALGTFAAEGVDRIRIITTVKQHPLVFRPDPPDGMQQHLSGSGRTVTLDCRLLDVPGLHPFSERPVGMACEVEEARWDISPFRVSAPCALRVLGRGAPAGSV